MGFVLRLGWVANDLSTNHDDAALAYSIEQRDFFGLFLPLDFGQLAPVGFLILEGAAIRIFGTSDLSFRLIPLLFGLGSSIIFRQLAVRLLAPRAAFLAVAFFCFSTDLITSTHLIKQYSGETFWSCLQIYSIVPVFDGWSSGGSGKRIKLSDLTKASVVSAIAIWFSLPSVFVVCGIVALLLFNPGKQLLGREAMHNAVVFMGLILLSALLWYFCFYRAVSVNVGAMTKIYWKNSFAPLDKPWDWPLWIAGVLKAMAGVSLGPRLAALGGVMIGISFFQALRVPTPIGIMAAVPVLATLAGGFVQIYPPVGRFLFFLSPLILLLISSQSINWVDSIRARWVSSVSFCVFSAVVFYLSISAFKYVFVKPTQPFDARGALAVVDKNWRDGDFFYAGKVIFPSILRYKQFKFTYKTPRTFLEGVTVPVDIPRDVRRMWFVLFDGIENRQDLEVLEGVDGQKTMILEEKVGAYTVRLWSVVGR